MDTLAIRQGDVLFFARSLVWSITMSELATYTEEQLLALSEASRYEMFLTAWERHLNSGLDPSQEEADRIAGIYHVKAKLKPREKPVAIGRVKTQSKFNTGF